MIKALLFDFDGVIAQSEPLHLRSFRQLLRSLGIRIPRDRWYRDFTGIGSPAIMRILFEENRITKNVKTWVEKRRRLYQRLVQQGKLRPLPGLRAFLRRAQKKGLVLAIVSGGHGSNIRLALKKMNLTGIFQTIVSVESVQNRKPHPEGFLVAAQRLRVKPSECLAIEDSPNGIRSASASGAIVVCIRSPAPLDTKKCDFVIRDFRSFPQHLLEWKKDDIVAHIQKGKISIGKGAQLLGVSYYQMLEILRQKGASFISVREDELAQEISVAKKG